MVDLAHWFNHLIVPFPRKNFGWSPAGVVVKSLQC